MWQHNIGKNRGYKIEYRAEGIIPLAEKYSHVILHVLCLFLVLWNIWISDEHLNCVTSLFIFLLLFFLKVGTPWVTSLFCMLRIKGLSNI